MSAITIREESASGQFLDTCSVPCTGDRIRVRDLLAERARARPVGGGDGAEIGRMLRAFADNKVFVMVEGRQVLSLEEEIAVEPDAEVRVIRLDRR